MKKLFSFPTSIFLAYSKALDKSLALQKKQVFDALVPLPGYYSPFILYRLHKRLQVIIVLSAKGGVT